MMMQAKPSSTQFSQGRPCGVIPRLAPVVPPVPGKVGPGQSCGPMPVSRQLVGAGPRRHRRADPSGSDAPWLGRALDDGSRRGTRCERSTARVSGVLICLALTVGLLAQAPAAAASGADRYLLVVAVNHSLDDAVPSLRYADDDGARYYELLAPGAASAVLLTTFDDDSQDLYPELVKVARPPTRANLLLSLETLRGEIEASRQQGRETTLHVVFTGHGQLEPGGGAARFGLLDGPWTRDDMVDRVIAPQWADFTHLVVDACNAYFLVQGRGWKDDEVEDPDYDRAVARYLTAGDVLHRYPRTGVLLSTAGAQEVHEWGAYRAGVFSHQLRSALVGAADVDGDGALRYDEIEAYIGAANAAVSNPKARVRVTARPPRQDRGTPWLRRGALHPRARLLIPAGQRGRFVIEDERGLRYADVTTGGDRPLAVALVAGDRRAARFHVSHGDQEAALELPGAVGADVLLGALAWADVGTRARSAVSEDFRANLFAVEFSADFYHGYNASLRAQAPAVAVEEEEPARWGVEGAVGLGQSLVGQGLGEVAAVGVRYGRRDGWFGRLQLEVGISEATLTPEADAGGLRHLAWGGGAGYALPLGAGFVAGPQLGLLHLIAAEFGGDGQTRADRTGLRGTAGVFVGTDLGDWYLGLSGDAAVNVISVLERDGDRTYLDDTAYLQVETRLVVRYDF